MDDIDSAKRTQRPPISEEEKARRRKIVREADASSRLEGAYRDPATDPIFEAFIQGEIEVTDIITHLKALSD